MTLNFIRLKFDLIKLSSKNQYCFVQTINDTYVTKNEKRETERETRTVREGSLEVSHIRSEEREKHHIKGEQYKQALIINLHCFCL